MFLKQITFRNLENVLMNYPDAYYKIYKYWLFLAVPVCQYGGVPAALLPSNIVGGTG
jgi:hypothetical protein